MRGGNIVFALVVFAAWPGAVRHDRARADEPAVLLRLRVVDAATGAPLPDVRAGLVDGSTGRVYARFSGAAYLGPRRPRAGDHVLAYARGHGIARCVLGKGRRDVELGLPRADRSAPVRIVASAPAGGAPAAPFRVRVTIEAEGAWPLPEEASLARQGRTPIRDVSEFFLASGSRVVSWGAGCLAQVTVESPGRIVWPLRAVLRDGEEAVFRVEKGREIEVVRDARGPGSLEVLPDLLWRPRVLPERVDAWRWHMNGPDWLEDGLRGPASQARIVPDVPFHLLAVIGSQPLQLHVDREMSRIPLDRPSEIGIVSGRPQVDAAPAPGGALIAAGRLDRLAICELDALRGRLPGLVHELPPVDAAWQPLRLPSLDWITVFDRQRGLAHLPWGSEVPPRGSYCRGTLRLRLPEGHRAHGHVMVFPVWRGTGAVRTAPPRADRLRHAWPEDADELLVHGLWGGTYGLDVDLDYEHAGSGLASSAPRFATVEVAGDPPVGEIVLAPPRR